MPKYENKFVNQTKEQDGESRIAFRLKQAEYSGQQGDVLFLSSNYPNCVLEGKKLSGSPEKGDDTCYNSYYFTEHAKQQYKETKDFAQKAGLTFLYFLYCTYGRGRKANFYVIPASYFEEDIENNKDTIKISVQKAKWNSLAKPWFKNIPK